MNKNNVIQEKSFLFALSIIRFYKKLSANREFVVGNQLLKSGTSIGANIEEALAAQSRKDFLHKMSLASKEGREIKYWLRLIDEGKIMKVSSDLFMEIEEINSILTSIVKTTAESLKK